jgi:hypothetical protein
MKKFAILLAIMALTSCKNTKTLTQNKETVKTDTIRTEKIIEKFRAVHDTLIIINPCDSSGLLKNFYSRLILPNGSIIIKSQKGQIKASIDIDSMRQEIQNNYRNSQVKWIEYRDKEVVKYRVPTWVFILLLIEVLAIFGFFYIKFWWRHV